MKILNFIKIVARASTAFIFISLLTIQSGYAVEETHSLIAKSGVLSGVVVHVGLTDINVARSIPQENSFLFYGLTTKPELVSSLRSSIRKAGMDTHAHVRLMKSYGKLPFAENLVNLVIADLDSTFLSDELGLPLLMVGLAYPGARRERLCPRPHWLH